MENNINEFVETYEEKVKVIAMSALQSLVSTPNCQSVEVRLTLSIHEDTKEVSLKLASTINVVKPD